MGFHEVRFPEQISYGSSGGPGFKSNIVEGDTHNIEVIQRLDSPQRSFDVAPGIASYEDVQTTIAFYMARQGAANAFRYKDWSDYTSNPRDPSFRGNVGVRDQRIGTGDGVVVSFQLIKKYTSGSNTATRIIQKPVNINEDGNHLLQVWVNGVELSESTDFTVDYATGIVLFAATPAVGQAVEASFEFDVPVRFDKDADTQLTQSLTSFGASEINPIVLMEEMDVQPGFVNDFFYGGAYAYATAASFVLSSDFGRVWSINCTATGKVVSLPSPTNYPLGGPIFYLINAGSNSFTLKDHLGATLATLTANQGVEVVLSLNSGGSKFWWCI